MFALKMLLKECYEYIQHFVNKSKSVHKSSWTKKRISLILVKLTESLYELGTIFSQGFRTTESIDSRMIDCVAQTENNGVLIFFIMQG